MLAAIAMEAMAVEANNGGFDGEVLTMDAMWAGGGRL